MKQLAPDVQSIYGVDISDSSVAFGREYLKECPNCKLFVGDVYALDGSSEEYDAVLCLQNGLSAFHGNGEQLIELALGMLKQGGSAYFSSYSPRFWKTRVA